MTVKRIFGSCRVMNRFSRVVPLPPEAGVDLQPQSVPDEAQTSRLKPNSGNPGA